MEAGEGLALICVYDKIVKCSVTVLSLCEQVGPDNGCTKRIFKSDPHNIIPLTGAPDSVEDCVLANQSAGSLHITCKPGADGGLTQTFR